MDLKVVHVDPITKVVSIKPSSKIVTGVDWLIQIVVLSILNDPGRAVLDPGDGGGLPELIGSNLSVADPEELYTEVQLRINKSASEIISQQIGLSLSPEERLRSLAILSIEKGAQADEVIIKLRLVNEAGRVIDLAV